MTFADFNLNPPLLNALDVQGITTPTPIQEKAFPVILSGKDMVGIAQTGTGKTLAFLLPVLKQWKYSKEKQPSVVIVVPTRELVIQITEEIEKLTQYTNIKHAGVYGGVNMIQQSPLIVEGVDILVGTPGRMLDFLLNGILKFRLVKKFIIDEVDEMLNLGFRPQLIRLMDFLPSKRQNLMFSATITPEIKNFIADNFIDPVEVEAARTGTPLVNIKQAAIRVPNFNTKVNLLHFLLKNHPEFSKVLLFASTKALADELYESLDETNKALTGIIHSNKSQNNRFDSLKKFNSGNYRMLVATDIVARGLDFDDVTHVVNFDMPEDAESYMHRIGRTGRIDKKGVALTFLTKEDADRRKLAEELMNQKIPMMGMPEEVEISTEIRDFELPEVKMKNVLVDLVDITEGGGAFHEKAGKNKKVNQKVRRSEAMKVKYGKPKTRGDKSQTSRKKKKS
jgi:ATP-dependent RNA helicase RhlE